MDPPIFIDFISLVDSLDCRLSMGGKREYSKSVCLASSNQADPYGFLLPGSLLEILWGSLLNERDLVLQVEERKKEGSY